MKLLILLASLIHLGSFCSCSIERNPYRSDRKVSIIKVRVVEILKSKSGNGRNKPSRPWEDAGSLYRKKVEVRAVVQSVIRAGPRNFAVGDEITVKSGMSDASCGAGGFLGLGETFTFSTYSRRFKRLQLCEYLAFNYELVQSRSHG
jgi:hypothetical protein